jgi:hypothetical protein
MSLSAFAKGQRMADKHFEIELPEEVLAGFGWHDAEVPHKVREALVMDLLRLDQISEAQAVALLHVDRWDLLETMGRYRIPAVRLSQDELKHELTQELRRGGMV